MLHFFKQYFQLAGKFYVGVAVSLTLDFLMTYLFPYILLRTSDSFWTDLLAFCFFVAAFWLPVRFIIRFILYSFGKKGDFTQLLVITHAYIGVIVIFGALYFDFNIIGDFWNQVNAEQHFQRVAGTKTYSAKYPVYPYAEHRAFRDFSTNLWTGVTNPDFEIMSELPATDIDTGVCYRCSFDDFVNGDISEVPPELSYELTKRKIEPLKLYKFQRRYITANFGECLYFSVITIATVGYGDISPQTWYTKIAVATEVLIGLIIFIFAVNFLFMTWNKGNSSSVGNEAA